ncbi:Uncharacterised protein [Escherichia coli]|uniref:Uncharacterized protein n=1 Tax=Escherichia coli TaxID=562 RepID=A0A377F5Q5_ECOLX|nr:Uncharacterised protein [Escherichia coli]
MSDWSLSQLFASLHEDIQLRLGTARKAFQHPGLKGMPVKEYGLKCLIHIFPNAIRQLMLL